ncbi:MAG: ATP-dependent protease ATPase subunit HslU [Myxococcota bacterium]
MSVAGSFTPREIVSELDRYIVGQQKAKRAVAVALRNRWRRQQVSEDLRDEISPKNIIMIGPTGCGKTEIARRLAKLAKAPFVKVEASKFTEVGYVGRDVESIIRDLLEHAVHLVRQEEVARVRAKAKDEAEERLVELLVEKRAPTPKKSTLSTSGPQMIGPFVLGAAPTAEKPAPDARSADPIRRELRQGLLEDEEIEIDVQDQGNPFMTVFGAHGPEEMTLNLRDMLGQAQSQRNLRKLKVSEARPILEEQEAHKLVDSDAVHREAIQRSEQSGIVFLDEIDKVARRSQAGSGPDISREGVQRDLLPIVEGSTVSTKYGSVKTDHILFIAAGAFHVTDVSDLIPELQGRFPIRVELESLSRDDLCRILTEPKNSLTRQYSALLATEELDIQFTPDGIQSIAGYAAEANERAEHIGARRLHTIMEALLEELSFAAPERSGNTVVVDSAYVDRTLKPIVDNSELQRFIL